MASIAELLDSGFRFEAEEAVAVAQLLIETLRLGDETTEFGPPYGPPCVANVLLNADGTIHCIGCGTTPAVSEVAIFLDTLLPAGSPRVPGGLRYAIARGMLDVDVPPFDSIEEFSQALTRHERGPRDAIVRGLLARAGGACTALERRPAFDRRVARATATDLRRELRNADARLYQQQLLRAAAMMSVPQVPPPQPLPTSRPQTAPAIAACVGAGMLLVAAGEIMHVYHPEPPNTPVRVASAPTIAIAEPAPVPALRIPATMRVSVDLPTLHPLMIATRADESRAAARPSVPRAAVAKSNVKRPLASSAARQNRGPRQPGVMDRLRLGWLRDAFKRS